MILEIDVGESDTERVWLGRPWGRVKSGAGVLVAESPLSLVGV